MKKNIIYIIATIFLLSCNSNDKQTTLNDLEKQQHEISEKIKTLKAEISSEGKTEENTQKLASVSVETIMPVNFDHFIEVQGTVESDNNILIPAQTSGIVEHLFVEEGEKVEKGQLLAELDGAIYEKSIEELNTALELATTVFERQNRLWDKKIGSEISFLQAKTNKESLERKLETIKEQYRLTKIFSPINGTVDNILIKEGEAAGAGFGAIRVVQLSDLKIKANLAENHISQVHKNDQVQVNISSSGSMFKSNIMSVSKVIDPENRTFKIELDIPKNIKNIKPNMLAVLQVKDYSNHNAMIIPLNVLQKTGNSYFIFLAKKINNKLIAKKTFIKMGKYYKNIVEISEGLKKGDKVIIQGFQNLSDGEVITII